MKIEFSSVNALDSQISAQIYITEEPEVTSANGGEHIVWLDVEIQGYGHGVEVKWIREYPVSVGYGDVGCEWDTPDIHLSAIDAHNGSVSIAARLASFATILDVTDQYFDRFLKGK